MYICPKCSSIREKPCRVGCYASDFKLCKEYIREGHISRLEPFMKRQVDFWELNEIESVVYIYIAACILSGKEADKTIDKFSHQEVRISNALVETGIFLEDLWASELEREDDANPWSKKHVE